MTIARLSITDFRNLTSVEIEPLPKGFNLLYGSNGSGKTSLLEAIYYLSLGRSFRSSKIQPVIHENAKKFCLFGQILSPSGQLIAIGMERDKVGQLKIKISGQETQSIAELAAILPLQLINSHCFDLLEGGPIFRRKYIDWGVFYFRKDFLVNWQAYMRALKQRNAVLRTKKLNEIEPWTQECVRCAAKLDEARQGYLLKLLPLLNENLQELLKISNEIAISYYPGWDRRQTYTDALNGNKEKDIQMGYTQFGPHRADLKIQINNLLAKEILSRGQQKLFICAMIAAQGMLLKKEKNIQPIYLVDDLPAELDIKSREYLLSLLANQESQVFITTVEPEIATEIKAKGIVKMFHVEHGVITEKVT